jgi:hypothetical protein
MPRRIGLRTPGCALRQSSSSGLTANQRKGSPPFKSPLDK